MEAARFARYRAAGVNRVSLGVQSLHDEHLRFLGRLHSAAEARQALGIAARHFDRVSFDLICARPGQTEAEWRGELTEALGLARGHLSLYQLTIEPETAFFDLHRRGKLKIPGAELAADLYELTQDLCESAGLPAYEIRTMRPWAKRAATISLIGVMAIISASGRAPMGGWRLAARNSPRQPLRRRRRGMRALCSAAMDAKSAASCPHGSKRKRRCSWGCA